MARFCELGIDADVVIGKSIDMDELFGRRVLIEKTIIQPTKYPGKNASGLRMQMQVVLATFNDTPDVDGDYYQKDANGAAVGERRSCFTGSDILISAIQKAESQLPALNKGRQERGEQALSVYPIDTTIVKVGKSFQFT
ncbi:MAG: hypothetical protein NC324_02465 [Bacteroides sp.]|nr:hypothetical protein [Bacteroides sp.]